MTLAVTPGAGNAARAHAPSRRRRDDEEQTNVAITTSMAARTEPQTDVGAVCSHDVTTFAGTTPGNAPCDPAGTTATSTWAMTLGGQAFLGDTDVTGRSRTRVRLPDGSPYPGDLVEDILEYRALRARALGGGHLGTRRRGLFERLEDRLRSGDEPCAERGHVRAYHRFDLSRSARLRLESPDGVVGPETVVQIRNISAGGVKLETSDAVEAGQRAWLVLPHHERAVVLTARVAWARGDVAGLMFAGAPAWD
jgi:hypothetical protein